MRTDFESRQSVEVIRNDYRKGDDGYNETEFTIGLECVEASSPGSRTQPPEGAEFEVTTILVSVPRVNRKPGGAEFDADLELTWNQFVALVGEDAAEAMFADACLDATENGAF